MRDLERTYRHARRRLFTMVTSGKLKVEVAQRYALTDAAQAHLDLEARKTTGSSILTI